MRAWKRLLTVTLTSSLLKKKLVFGREHLNNNFDLEMDIKISKYMSSLKDTAVIKISNLTYEQVIEIIQGKFYDVEIKAGYQDTGENLYFKGGVLWITNEIENDKTQTITITCASQLVAKYGQQRLNLSLNSGVNMYSALNFVCRRAGIPNTNISTQLQKEILRNNLNIDSTVAGWLDELTKENPYYITNSDSITNSVVSFFNSDKSNQRVIPLSDDMINLTGGFPTLTTDGLRFSIIPTFSFMCGDTIKMNNSLINIEGSQKENAGYFVDKNGMYMIYEMQLNLQNRGSKFSINLTCKSRSAISNYLGR